MRIELEMSVQEYRALGKCLKMCPDSEINLRERENLLHPFEVAWDHCPRRPLADPSKMVKAYRRPTVGKDENPMSEIRPPWVLRETVDYLLDSLTQGYAQEHGFQFKVDRRIASLERNWAEIYDFIFDRLRAVRQDLVIQEAEGIETIEILEKAIRFHLFSDYWLCTEHISVFDPKINNQHSQECLKRLLNFYKSSARPCDNRAEFESVYLLFNLGETDALNHYLSLDKCLRKSPVIQQAYEISISYLLGNWVRCNRLIRQLRSPTLLCAVQRHLPHIQRRTIHSMCIAYNSKLSKFPISKLTHILCLNTDTETEKFCESFGLSIVGCSVQLMKNSFKDTNMERQHYDFVSRVIKQQTISELLHGRISSLEEDDKFCDNFTEQCGT